MNLQDLEIIISISETRNYADSAYKLNVSESVISRHILAFEEETGIKVFNRAVKGKAITLTKEGEYILPYILSVCNKHKNLQKAIATAKGEYSPLHIGYPTYLIDKIAHSVIDDFIINNKNIQVFPHSRYRDELLPLLKVERIEVAFYPSSSCKIVDQLDDEEYGKILIDVLPRVYLRISNRDPLANKTEITKEDIYLLKDRTILSETTKNDTCHNVINDFMQDEYPGFDIYKNSVFISGNKDIMDTLVSNKKCICFVPGKGEKKKHKGYSEIPVKGIEKNFYYFVIYKKNASTSLMKFVEFINKKYKINMKKK